MSGTTATPRSRSTASPAGVVAALAASTTTPALTERAVRSLITPPMAAGMKTSHSSGRSSERGRGDPPGNERSEPPNGGRARTCRRRAGTSRPAALWTAPCLSETATTVPPMAWMRSGEGWEGSSEGGRARRARAAAPPSTPPTRGPGADVAKALYHKPLALDAAAAGGGQELARGQHDAVPRGVLAPVRPVQEQGLASDAGGGEPWRKGGGRGRGFVSGRARGARPARCAPPARAALPLARR